MGASLWGTIILPTMPLLLSEKRKMIWNVLFKNFLFIFWLLWVFVAVLGLPLAAMSRDYSSLGSSASLCGGSSCCGSWALDHGISSCGTRAYLLCGIVGSSQLSDQTCVLCPSRWILNHRTTREVPPPGAVVCCLNSPSLCLLHFISSTIPSSFLFHLFWYPMFSGSSCWKNVHSCYQFIFPP